MHEKKDTLIYINRKLKTFSKSEKKTAIFILKNPEKVVLLPLRKLAEECGVSEPTVIRFCRVLGFSGYQDFKLSLIPYLLKRGKAIHEGINFTNKDNKWVADLSNNLCRSVIETFQEINVDKIKQIAQMIKKANNIIIIGLGGAGAVAYIFAESLTGLGLISYASSDPSYLQLLASVLKKGDLIIGISHSGETEEIIKTIARAKKEGIETVAITNYEKTALELSAEVTIFTNIQESLLGSYSCEPRLIELAIIELILLELSHQVENN